MKKIIFQLMVHVFLVGLLGSWVLAGDKPRPGGTMIIARSADSTYLDPARFLDNESAMVIENIFDGLVRYANHSTAVEPALAEKWERSPDNLEWIFHLRSGVRFHDGSDFNARAVEFSFLRKIDPEHPYFSEDFQRMDTAWEVVSRVKALDEKTVRVTLNRPYAPFLDLLARHSSFIVSPLAVEKLGDEFYRHPVGTGPFVFQDWEQGKRITLSRNPDYWRGRPYLDQVVFLVMPDNRDRLLALKTGSVHCMDGINPEDVQDLTRRPDLELDYVTGLNVGYLAMNTSRHPWSNPLVRQAVNHSINKQALVRLLFRDLGEPARNPIPPTMWGYNHQIRDWEHDPEKAGLLLAQAGLEKGFATTIWTTRTARPYMPDPERTARVIQANLDVVGIRAEIRTFDWSEYLARLYNGEHDLALLGWIGTGDPDNFFYNLFDARNAVPPRASNISFFEDSRAQELMALAREDMDMEIRAGYYRELQEVIHRKAPWVPLAYARQVLARRSEARDIVYHPTGVHRYYQAWLDR
ncbi:ABC transporter substrate-binding protein [Desulfonatronovibrio hydrogenovorans]|uniref:ABC transporter substrate-binding protein n=1 Tax=Desulfonatronovibrio hydrogenovorans TaxID=53245 RepID=UPI0004917426|nr:ABC transporter substrate-binding protein [Desulfonatronovibrio hydrogenovorans]